MIKFELKHNFIEFFQKNGFLIVDKFIESNYLEKLRNKFEPLFCGEFETGNGLGWCPINPR